MTALVVAGLAALVAGGALAALRPGPAAGLLLQAGGIAALGVAGGWILAAGSTWGDAFTSELTPRFGIDGLSGLFLVTLAVAAVPALVFASGYVVAGARGRLTGALGAVFLIALVGALCARDALSFLFWWELMTLAPAALILVGSATESSRRTVFTYVAITHLGGAGAWIALLLLASHGALGGTAPPAEGSALQIAIALAAIVGFGTKAGLVPLHAWLPRTHPIAPAHVSALMSGVMVAIGSYGLVRVLVEWLGPVPSWIAVLVLALGGLSALTGITYALFQRDLKRLLAYSTVEHLGIVALALGATLLLRGNGASAWAALALAAALLHVLNHAVFKTLLFLCAGTLERVAGGLELDRLGGFLRALPLTGSAFLVGALAIAGIPLLNGFASEWLALQALVRATASGDVWEGTMAALALAALAATVGIAILCFAKVIGLVLLGPSRRPAYAVASEPGRAMRGSVAALAAACVVLGTLPGLLVGRLAALAPWPHAEVVPVRPGLDVPGTGDLHTVGILVALVGTAALLGVARRSERAAPSPTWACGQRLSDRLLWTSAGFSKPLRLVLQPVLRPEREVAVTTRGGVVERVSYAGSVPPLLDLHLYRPLARRALQAAALARRLQSGRLSTYVAYLIGLVLALLFAVRLGAL